MKKEKYYCKNCKKELDEVELLFHGKDWLVWDNVWKKYIKNDTEENDTQVLCPDCGSIVHNFENI